MAATDQPSGARLGARRVAFLDHTAKMGGGEIALLNLVRNLDPSRYVPVVGLFSDGPLAERLRASGVEVHVLPLSDRVVSTRKDSLGGGTLLRARDVWDTARYAWRLRRALREWDVVAVHTNSLKADVIGGVAARLAGLPVVWHVRDRIDADYLPRPVVGAFRILCGFLPTYVIANSDSTLRTLALRRRNRGSAVSSGIDLAPRMGVVHDSAGHDAIEPAAPRAAGAPVVSLVGRLTRWKGQHVFIRAAEVVHRQVPGARFQIIGGALFDEQAYEAEVKGLADELGLAGVVHFLGHRTDTPALIHHSDVLVHASITGEPFGQVVVEGMAAGKPVVATDGGGVPEIVVDGVTGLLVPMGDAPAMADAILHLLRHPDLGRRMGLAGLERVNERFLIGNTARKIESIYDDLLAGRPRPGHLSGRRPRIGGRDVIDWRRPARGVAAAVLLAGGALGLKTLLGPSLHGPTFATFYAAVVLAAWGFGPTAGLAAVVASCLACAFFVVSPARLATSVVDQGRLTAFAAVSLLIVFLFEAARRANARADDARQEAERMRREAECLERITHAALSPQSPRDLVDHAAYFAARHVADGCLIECSDASGRLLAEHWRRPPDHPGGTDRLRAALASIEPTTTANVVALPGRVTPDRIDTYVFRTSLRAHGRSFGHVTFVWLDRAERPAVRLPTDFASRVAAALSVNVKTGRNVGTA